MSAPILAVMCIVGGSQPQTQLLYKPILGRAEGLSWRCWHRALEECGLPSRAPFYSLGLLDKTGQGMVRGG